MPQSRSGATEIAGRASSASLSSSNTENLEAAGGFTRCFASCSHSLRTILAIAAVSLATAGCSLTQEREPPPPAALAERTPSSAVAMAFAALNEAPANTAVVNGPNAQGSCKDLEFSFLNSVCSRKHKKHATIRHHRVATFVIGRPDTTTSSVRSAAEPANVGHSAAQGSDAGSTSADQRANVPKPGPTMIAHACRNERAATLVSSGSSLSVGKLGSGETRLPSRVFKTQSWQIRR